VAKVFFWLLNSAFFHRLFRMGQSLYLNDNAFVELFSTKRKMDIFPSFIFSKDRIPILGKTCIHPWCLVAKTNAYRPGNSLAMVVRVTWSHGTRNMSNVASNKRECQGGVQVSTSQAFLLILITRTWCECSTIVAFDWRQITACCDRD
jgi:hypothetical protein